MLQPIEARNGDYRRVWRRPGLDRPPVRRVLFQRIVRSIFVIVVHVISDQSAEMLFVQRDDVVENLSPATSHPSFRDSVLPGRLHARTLQVQSGCSQEGDDVGVKLRVPIEDEVTIGGGFVACGIQKSLHLDRLCIPGSRPTAGRRCSSGFTMTIAAFYRGGLPSGATCPKPVSTIPRRCPASAIRSSRHRREL
jgi:hypothetical protein